MKKPQKLDSIYFRGKSHFEEDGTQNYLVLIMSEYFKRVVNSVYILEWKSKWLSDESIKSGSEPNNFLNLKLSCYGNKMGLIFSGSCLKQDRITHDHVKVVNSYIVYEINKNFNISSYPTLENLVYLVLLVWLKNIHIDKYKYSGYGNGFDRHGILSHPSGGTGRNVLIFGVDMSSSTKIDNREKYILILGKGYTQGLEHTLSAAKMYSISFTENDKKFCLSLHYNGANSYLFVNGIEIYKFKATASESVASTLCLGNISRDWAVDNMKKTGLMDMFMILVLIMMLLQLMIH